LRPICCHTITRFLVSSLRWCSMRLRRDERSLLVDALLRAKLRGELACGWPIRFVLRTRSVRSRSLKITVCGLDPRAGATPVCGRLSRHKPASLVSSLRGSLPPLGESEIAMFCAS
jgi:hypothetical protein